MTLKGANAGRNQGKNFFCVLVSSCAIQTPSTSIYALEIKKNNNKNNQHSQNKDYIHKL